MFWRKKPSLEDLKKAEDAHRETVEKQAEKTRELQKEVARALTKLKPQARPND